MARIADDYREAAGCDGDELQDLARDLLDARAEVERLRGVREAQGVRVHLSCADQDQADRIASDIFSDEGPMTMVQVCRQLGEDESEWSVIITRWPALALPTPAPEATDG